MADTGSIIGIVVAAIVGLAIGYAVGRQGKGGGGEKSTVAPAPEKQSTRQGM